MDHLPAAPKVSADAGEGSPRQVADQIGVAAEFRLMMILGVALFWPGPESHDKRDTTFSLSPALTGAKAEVNHPRPNYPQACLSVRVDRARSAPNRGASAVEQRQALCRISLLNQLVGVSVPVIGRLPVKESCGCFGTTAENVRRWL
ncbi:hypothetical protein DP939_32875 [Spongiactinospora rosea]|uniref:Uncharacterized protein n=1 Tax=Spongiactinospora rosea TaxID=2248750 RepID=A0A366LR77_9ACTN|nr:hypothetical protein DP939_32875 [Spongiactinospora rosea]